VAQQALPDDPAANDALGWVYVRRNSDQLGLPYLREAVRAAPNTALYRYHLGMAQLQTGRRTAARADLTQALALDSSFRGAERAREALASIRP
jgi:Flp pilus assembly protein TadD